MHGRWQQCWLATPASMVGNRFVVLAILLRLHTSFHWGILTKTYKQLSRVFVVIILCAVYVADAFGSRSPLTTTQVMSTPLSKHLQEPSLDGVYKGPGELDQRNKNPLESLPASRPATYPITRKRGVLLAGPPIFKKKKRALIGGAGLRRRLLVAEAERKEEQ